MKKKSKVTYIDDLDNSWGRDTEQAEMLRRVFQGMELIDAKASIYLTVKDEDKVGAIPHDLEHCVFAKTCHRLFDSRAMVFMRSTAYVDLEDEDGIRKVHRFRMGSGMEQAVAEYDRTNGEVFRAGTYLLRAPAPSVMLNNLRAKSKKRRIDPIKRKRERKAAQRKSVINSTAKIKAKSKSKAGVAGPRGVIRLGTGLVHTRVVE
jgi:hypothetical protein